LVLSALGGAEASAPAEHLAAGARDLRDIFRASLVQSHRRWRARATGLVPAWNHRAKATVLVLLMLFGRVTERFSSDFTTYGIIGIASLVASLVPLTAAQRVANRANGQSFLDQGDSDVEHEDEGEEEE